MSLNIDSKLWRVRYTTVAHLDITQKASGVTRTFSQSALPSSDELASMSEQRFDKLCRERFHGWEPRRGQS